jgi:hypothetical protein
MRWFRVDESRVQWGVRLAGGPLQVLRAQPDTMACSWGLVGRGCSEALWWEVRGCCESSSMQVSRP